VPAAFSGPARSASRRRWFQLPRLSPRGLELAGRALAHEIDRRRGVAGRGHQAVGAAQHLDPVVDRAVQIALLPPVGEGQAQAVDLEVADVEAARAVVGAVGLDALDLDAGGVVEHVVDAVEPEVIHLRTGEHADRLRRVLERQIEPGGRAGGARL
jgi:hypothetical protein